MCVMISPTAAGGKYVTSDTGASVMTSLAYGTGNSEYDYYC